MSEQLSERGKDLVKYMPQAVNALADRLIEKLEERLLYGEKPPTNADRVRQMTDEELAGFIWDGQFAVVKSGAEAVGFEYKVDEKKCIENLLLWLKSPAEEG